MASQSDGSEFSWDGCSLVLLAFVYNFLTVGLHKTMGVLLPTLRDQFVTHTWMIGIMVTTMNVTCDVMGKLPATTFELKLSNSWV